MCKREVVIYVRLFLVSSLLFCLQCSELGRKVGRKVVVSVHVCYHRDSSPVDPLGCSL